MHICGEYVSKERKVNKKEVVSPAHDAFLLGRSSSYQAPGLSVAHHPTSVGVGVGHGVHVHEQASVNASVAVAKTVCYLGSDRDVQWRQEPEMGSHQRVWEKRNVDGTRGDLRVEVQVEWEHILRVAEFAFEVVRVH